jgi:hypothetical protein
VKKIILRSILCVSIALAFAACTQQEQNILKGATTLATAIANTALPPEVAVTPTGQAITYWSQYASGLLEAVNTATSANSTTAQGQ